MKKFFAYLSLCVCVVAVGFAFSACSKKIESIALKDGIIKNEYFVGEQFDRTVGTIVAKQGNSYQEIPLTNTEIEILNFSTANETQKATAQITYKGVTLNFDYSVRLRTLQDFEVTGGSYIYDGSVRDVSISNLMEDVTVTKTYANLDKFGEPFVGAKNVGKYYINVTVSKQGFESVTKSAVIEIAPKEIEVRLTLPQNLTYDGTIKEVGAEIVSGLVEGDTCGVYIGGTETAKDAGEYSSYIVGSTNINYTISENTPQEENPIVWEILKADAIGVSAESVGFDSKQVPYDGTKHTIVATNALVLNAGSTMEENSTSIRYTYCQGDNCKVSSSGVTDAGVYTVYLTYKFKNYNDLVFRKTLTITPKDLNMVEFLEDEINIGIDSFKIEGRMRSIYYVATVIWCYRKMIDGIVNKTITDADKKYYLAILNRCANRESAPQFFDKLPGEAEQYFTGREELSNQDFLGLVVDYDDDAKIATIETRNYFEIGTEVEFFGPNTETFRIVLNKIYNDSMESIAVSRHPKTLVKIPVAQKLEKNDFMRLKVIDKSQIL